MRDVCVLAVIFQLLSERPEQEKVTSSFSASVETFAVNITG